MKRFTNLWLLVLFVVIGFILLASCQSDETAQPNNPNQSDDSNQGNEEPNNGKDDEDPAEIPSTKPWAYDGEPTTVRMLISVGEEEFYNRFKRQVEEEFPNITLELMQGNPADNQYIQEELFAKGNIPDIMTVNPNYELVVELDALEPIDEYVEKRGFDLSIFRENVVENLRSRDPTGKNQLYGLPIESMLIVLYYNKDIFDMFGEPYPTDDMTWSEALDKARRLTQVRDGIQYKGLVLSRTNAIPYTQLSIPSTDPETGEVLFADHPDTKRVFELLDELRNIPGILEPGEDGFHTGSRNVAMWVNTAQFLPLIAPVEGFNFDMVATPTWEHAPGVAPTVVDLSFNIVKYSENKDAAWSVIAFLATEQAQIVLSQAGSPPTIESEEAYEQFGAITLEQYGKDYNVKAPFVNKAAAMAPYSRFGPDITFHHYDFISMKTYEFLSSDKDVNTYLREMKEEYEAIVEEMKAQQ